MARRCEICGKEGLTGNLVSHAHNKTKRKTRANIQKVKTVVNGTHKRLKVCTSCLRSGKVEKRSA